MAYRNSPAQYSVEGFWSDIFAADRFLRHCQARPSQVLANWILHRNCKPIVVVLWSGRTGSISPRHCRLWQCAVCTMYIMRTFSVVWSRKKCMDEGSKILRYHDRVEK